MHFVYLQISVCMNGLVENISLECHSCSFAEHCADMEYKFVELMPLYMKIGICFIEVFVCHTLRLQKILKSLFK